MLCWHLDHTFSVCVCVCACACVREWVRMCVGTRLQFLKICIWYWADAFVSPFASAMSNFNVALKHSGFNLAAPKTAMCLSWDKGDPSCSINSSVWILKSSVLLPAPNTQLLSVTAWTEAPNTKLLNMAAYTTVPNSSVWLQTADF